MMEDWVECKLGDLLKLKNGFAFKSKSYLPQGIPVIRIGDIKNWSIDIEGAKKIDESEEYEAYKIKKGDILIAMSGATTGKFGIYQMEEKAYQNQRVGNLIPHNDSLVLRKFIFYLLYSLKRDIERKAYGGAQPNISATKIHELDTKLFPLPIQRAIVARIEELFSSLDQGVADLQRAQEQLRVYRQAVLKKAFSGFPDKIQLIKDLVEKVQIGPFGSQLHKSDYITGGTPLINPMHIKKGKVVPQSNYSITVEKRNSLPNYILREGDVIMGRRGEMGRAALVTKREDGWMCGTGSLYIRPIVSSLFPPYLDYYLRSSKVKEVLKENASGTTMKNLNKRIINNLPIPVPILVKQRQIVKEIESRLSICDQVEANIQESLAKAEALRQSILKKAFEGELLTAAEIAACKEEADYEPAAVLLARMKAEQKK